ncbi:MAG: hypothetical protein GY932_14850 [Arcobacter sp.]|nr:hypothetical protein [Arcobacter sp.]
MSKSFTLTDKINLKVVARNFENAEKIQGHIKLLDEKKKELAKKEFETSVNNYKAKYSFVTEKLAKSFEINPEEVYYVKGWMDSDNDRIIDYNEEVLIDFIEEEVLITVIVELPHSKETGWGAKGLAGHTAMSIGDRFFDYGPDYNNIKTFDEKEYQADLNQDGDMDDKVKIGDIPNAGFKFAPGRPWWGEMISNNPEKVTLSQSLNFISKNWKINNVYGTVYKIEFYVKKSQADKMIEWWEDRYKHLKVYSVKPWTGEQCTTTVKEALAYGGIDDIDWNTITPDAILEDLKTEIKSTSRQHKDEKAKITLIKKEAKDWKPLN